MAPESFAERSWKLVFLYSYVLTEKLQNYLSRSKKNHKTTVLISCSQSSIYLFICPFIYIYISIYFFIYSQIMIWIKKPLLLVNFAKYSSFRKLFEKMGNSYRSQLKKNIDTYLFWLTVILIIYEWLHCTIWGHDVRQKEDLYWSVAVINCIFLNESNTKFVDFFILSSNKGSF